MDVHCVRECLYDHDVAPARGNLEGSTGHSWGAGLFTVFASERHPARTLPHTALLLSQGFNMGDNSHRGLRRGGRPLILMVR